jgi:hypothetical protein
MTCSEITLRDAIEGIMDFNPIKIVFNNIALYNDYDSDLEIEDGVYGEFDVPLNVIPNRLLQFDRYVVTSINVEIVEFHHSIITMQGVYKESE